MLKLIECPRDAMQGMSLFIETADKVRYINKLLQIGFDTIDFGSFVSAKAIPQMRDTAEVLSQLDLHATKTKLLAIVANERGAEQAAQFPEIQYIGFPFSVSETFQIRNTNSTIIESLERVKKIQELCTNTNKELVLYLSMGFGNPYGDPWNSDIVLGWVSKLRALGIHIFALSDTIGVSTPQSIEYLFTNVIKEYADLEIGAHLHSTPNAWREKIHAAYQSGCRRFDSALKGLGGCPMAKDDLTGNIATENLISYFNERDINLPFNYANLIGALGIANEIFPQHN